MPFVENAKDDGTHGFLVLVLVGKEAVAKFLVAYGPVGFIDKVAVFPFVRIVGVFVSLCKGIIGFPIRGVVVLNNRIVRTDSVKGSPKSFFDSSS